VCFEPFPERGAEILKGVDMRRSKRKEKGFTLIELLIVMIILGLLAALVGPRMFGKVGKSRQNAAKAQIALFETALDTYRLDTGKYPTGLKALRVNAGVKRWDGPYLAKPVPRDPWGNPYQYTLGDKEKGEYELKSFGADGAEGGEGEDADISNLGEDEEDEGSDTQ